MKFDYDYRDFKFSHKTNYPATMVEGFNEHFHSSYEMLYFLKGGVEFYIESKKYTLKPYDLVFIRPGEHHYMELTSDSTYERMVFRFPDYVIPNIIKIDLQEMESIYNIEKVASLRDLIDQYDIYEQKFYGDKLQLLFHSLLTGFLVQFSSLENNQVKSPEIIDERISAILEYINENIESQISIADICKTFYISKSKLYKSFSEVMKIPIGTYIRNKKIMYAHKLILDGHNPTKIYDKCGFNYYSTFYRTYLKIFNVPPSNS